MEYRRDHPDACGVTATPVPAQPFPFFRLLPEIRAQILRLCLCRDKQIWQRVEWSCFGYQAEQVFDRPIDTRLLAVSAQMRAEAKEAFYSVNQFTLGFRKDEDLPHFILSPRLSFQCLRHMTVLVAINYSAGLPWLAEKLKTIWPTLQQCTNLSWLKVVGAFVGVNLLELTGGQCECMDNLFQELLGPYTPSPAVGTLDFFYEDSPAQVLGCPRRLIG